VGPPTRARNRGVDLQPPGPFLKRRFVSASTVRVRFLGDYIDSFLRDCRRADGECAIEDRFRTLFFDDYLPSTGVVFCSPV
jgi:hypothetical protein